MAGEKQAENAIERLYARPLSEFAGARDALAKELAAAGEVAKAKEVKALRRPTVSAWVVDRLAREARADLESLFDAADRMRGTKGDALREAMRDRAAAHARLTSTARAILEKAKHPAQAETLRRVTRTLHAAEVDAAARAQVESATVARDLDASLLDDDAAPPPAKIARSLKGEAKEEARARKERAEEERRTRAARAAEAKRAEQAMDLARRTVESADRKAAHARSALDSAKRAVESAEDEARTARRRLDETERGWRAAVAATASNDSK